MVVGRFDPQILRKSPAPTTQRPHQWPTGNLSDSDGELNNSGYTDQDGFFIPMDNH